MYNFIRPWGDPQDQRPVCYCSKCLGEIYYGEVCYPIDGWQTLCEQCYEETGETSGEFIYAGDDDGKIHIRITKEKEFDEE